MMHAWFDAGDGRKVYRRVPEPKAKRSHLPCPMLVRAFSEPVQSMATGEWFTSKTGLANSYKATGNPQGVEYIELGNEKPESVEHVADPLQRRNDIKQAMQDVISGNLPPEILAIE